MDGEKHPISYALAEGRHFYIPGDIGIEMDG